MRIVGKVYMKTPIGTRRSVFAALCCVAALGAGSLHSHAADVLQVVAQPGQATLVVNGTGIRRDAAADLYAATLYVEQKTSDPAQVVLNRGQAKFRIVLLKDARASQLTQLLTQGLVANASDDELITLVSEIFEVSMLLNEQGSLAAGDSIEVASHPANGITVTLHTAKPSTQSFANPLFFKVMMGVWLGKQPADPGLKRALLGLPS